MMNLRWVRSPQGWMAGVCQGLAEAVDLPANWVRGFFVATLFFGGTGLLIYILLALSLPRSDRLDRAMEPRLLGVCVRISRQSELEIGIVRFLTLALGLLSFGATAVGYVVLHFVLPQPKQV